MARPLLTKKEKLQLKVLKDARQQVTDNVYKAKPGKIVNTTFLKKLGARIITGLIPFYNIPKDYLGFEKSTELQPLLKKARKEGLTCKVCVKGSLLLSTVILNNKFKVKDCDTDLSGCCNKYSSMDSRLIKLFSYKQLALMERAFEGRFNLWELTNEEIKAADSFFCKYKTPKKRLMAILDNTIANKGIFKP